MQHSGSHIERVRLIPLAALGLAAMSCVSHSQEVRDWRAEWLIGQLVHAGQPRNGVPPSAWSYQFMALDEEPWFNAGIYHESRPQADPTIKKLIQMGVAALPSLLAHLRDRRLTPFKAIHDGSFGGMEFGMWFDPRFPEPHRQPSLRGVVDRTIEIESTPLPTDPSIEAVLDFNAKRKTWYRLRVGDICYTAVGQIVNRELSAVTYHPTMNMDINSPVGFEALAKATRSDWRGLTELSHERQLETDAYSDEPFAAGRALKRLLYYYPSTGERVALRLLQQEIFDDIPMRTSALQIAKARSAAEQKQIYSLAEKNVGVLRAKTIPRYLHDLGTASYLDWTDEDRARSRGALSELFPKFSPYKNVYYGVETMSNFIDLVDSVNQFPNPKIDRAVHNVFLRALDSPAAGKGTDRQHRYVDALAFSCARRLIGRGYCGTFARYFSDRAAEEDRAGGDPELAARLRRWAKKSTPNNRVDAD